MGQRTDNCDFLMLFCYLYEFFFLVFNFYLIKYDMFNLKKNVCIKYIKTPFSITFCFSCIFILFCVGGEKNY